VISKVLSFFYPAVYGMCDNDSLINWLRKSPSFNVTIYNIFNDLNTELLSENMYNEAKSYRIDDWDGVFLIAQAPVDWLGDRS
jgi:hypothetical protein